MRLSDHPLHEPQLRWASGRSVPDRRAQQKTRRGFPQRALRTRAHDFGRKNSDTEFGHVILKHKWPPLLAATVQFRIREEE